MRVQASRLARKASGAVLIGSTCALLAAAAPAYANGNYNLTYTGAGYGNSNITWNGTKNCYAQSNVYSQNSQNVYIAAHPFRDNQVDPDGTYHLTGTTNGNAHNNLQVNRPTGQIAWSGVKLAVWKDVSFNPDTHGPEVLARRS